MTARRILDQLWSTAEGQLKIDIFQWNSKLLQKKWPLNNNMILDVENDIMTALVELMESQDGL